MFEILLTPHISHEYKRNLYAENFSSTPRIKIDTHGKWFNNKQFVFQRGTKLFDETFVLKSVNTLESEKKTLWLLVNFKSADDNVWTIMFQVNKGWCYDHKWRKTTNEEKTHKWRKILRIWTKGATNV